jgi:hypothetical protein
MKCIIHIGTEKTATTLLQKWLYENEGNFSAQGIALTRSAQFPNNMKLAGYFQDRPGGILRINNITNSEERDLFFNDFEAEFFSELDGKSKTHDTFIITSEHFHSGLTSPEALQNLKEFLDRFFSEYRIVCYFREQTNVRKSLYSTALKNGYSGKIEDFANDVGSESHYYNYLNFFRLWEDAFGKDNLLPRLFDKEHLAEGDIRKDFLATALPQVDADGMSFRTVSANESLSRFPAEIFRAINATRGPYAGRVTDPKRSFFKSLVANAYYLDSRDPIYDARQADLYDIFNSLNIEFFDRYFGVKRNLFNRPIKTLPHPQSEVSLGEDDIVDLILRIFENDRLLVMREKEINFLRDLAIRFYDSGKLSATEAIVLLRIASRARPEGSNIRSKIEKLSNKA